MGLGDSYRLTNFEAESCSKSATLFSRRQMNSSKIVRGWISKSSVFNWLMPFVCGFVENDYHLAGR